MFTRTLLHIWGPFCVYTYGAMGALGAFVAYYALCKDHQRASVINQEDCTQLLMHSIIVGILGGRLLYIISNYSTFTRWVDMLFVHQGGIHMWGVVLALLVFLPCYLYNRQIAVLPVLDIFSIYGSLFQAIARLGCLFAGCCYGAPTDLPWAIRYTNPDTLAPLYCWLHPAQLYSSLSFLCLFALLLLLRPHIKTAGVISCIYLFLSSLSRLSIDFLRDDREFIPICKFFSLHQLIALGLMTTAVILYFGIMYNKRNEKI